MDRTNEHDGHEWMTLQEIADTLRCNERSVYRHLVRKKGTGIVWLKQPFRRGVLLAQRDSVLAYLRKLQKKTYKTYNPVVTLR